MNKINLFVSVPMHGRDDSEVQKEIIECSERLSFICDEYGKTKVRFDPINWDVKREDIPEGSHRLIYLGRAIQDLSKADMVAFIGDFRNAKGCQIEHRVCELYNIPFVEIYDGLTDTYSVALWSDINNILNNKNKN